jgi:hypothetical protein
MDEPGQGQPIVIDERWLTEWFEYGWANLNAFLALHAAFGAWCLTHNRKD